MYNKVILTGRVGREVELKSSKSGNQFCNLSVVTDTGFGDNKRSDWHSVVAFGKTAETCARFVTKGTIVIVEGSIQYDKFEKDGKKLTSTKIVADKVIFVSGTRKASEPQDNQVSATEYESLQFDDNIPF